MDTYLEAQGVDNASELTWTDPNKVEMLDEEIEGETLGESELKSKIELNALAGDFVDMHIGTQKPLLGPELFYVSLLSIFIPMYTLNPHHSGSLSVAQLNKCIAYRNALSDHHLGQGKHPGVEPRAYQLYQAIMMAKGDEALAAAQEQLQHMLASILSAKRRGQPSVQTDVPRIPLGFMGMIKTLLALRI
ncbi:hypothetical protein FRC07_004229, partial [Ceratobasidium sp. 392]